MLATRYFDRGRVAVRSTLIAAVLMLTGCFGGGSLSYHLIDPQADAALTDAATGLRLEVLDVQIPRYLDRNPIVSRDREGQLLRSSTHHWGDSLRHNLMRTTIRDLSVLLDSEQIGSSRDPLGGAVDYRILITVLEFERDAQGGVVLEARWQILPGADGGEPERQRTRLHTDDVDRGIPGQVRAMEVLYGELTTTIARALLDHAGVGGNP